MTTATPETSYDVSKDLESKNNANLKNLFDQINELKNDNKGDDSIDKVFSSSEQLNENLKSALESCKPKDIRILVTELGKIESDVSLQLDDQVKDSVKRLKNLLQNILNEKQVKPASLNEFEGYIRDGNLNKLNKLNSKEINEIVKFIEDGGLSEDDLISLCKMMDDQILKLADSNVRHTDEKNFKLVREAIGKVDTSLSKPNSPTAADVIKEHDLDKIFSEKTPGFLAGLFEYYIGNPNEKWSGAPLDTNLNFNEKSSKDNLSFTVRQFIDRFNKANNERIKGAKEKGLNFVNDAKNHGKIEFDGNGKITLDKSRDFIAHTLADIVDENELNADYFEDVRKAWKEAMDKAVEAEKDKGRENIGKSEIGKQTITGIKEINGFLQDENLQFLGLDDKNQPRFNYEKAKQYLESLLKIDSKEATRDNFKNKGGAERKAWIAAVQILRNYPSVDDPENKIKVDGIDGPETYKSILEFQKTRNLTKKDGKPGPETIKALLEGRKRSDNTTPETIENPSDLGLTEKTDVTNKTDYGIQSNATIYFKSEDTNGLYYKAGGNLIRVSTDEPRTKKSINMPNNNSWEMKGANDELNVCKAGATKLNDIIKNSSSNYLKQSNFQFSLEGDNYELKQNNNKINIPNDFFTKDFCGKEEMEDKLILLELATYLSSDDKKIVVLEKAETKYESVTDRADINFSQLFQNEDDYNAFKSVAAAIAFDRE